MAWSSTTRLWLALLLATGFTRTARAADAVSFVRPILSDKCFACHGPEEASREGGFRLDVQESALGAADSGARPIVPGDLEASELIARITSDDESLRMPPPDSHKTLSPEEIDTLRSWIAAGAPWNKHWSLVPPTRPELPTVTHAKWPRAAVDSFILARLEKEGLAPSPEADRATLLRRVTLDLTGLPPTPAEVDAFLADSRPDAYEQVVDRLLASSRYGEHMARFWLDAARYGDTHGLHLDNYREMWPYRDWVVRSFNGNLPYDKFLIEQLAGDLLPAPTEDQLIATGFNRCHVTTSEGGSIDEEVYVRNVVDRVETFGTVMLGLTIGCARCHDHKYDPLTMGDFYSLFAHFNSLEGNALDGDREDPAPVMRVATAPQTARLAELDAQLAAFEARLAGDWPELDAQQATWEQQFSAAQSAIDPAAPPTAKSELPATPPEVLAALQRTAAERTPEQRVILRQFFRNTSALPAELAKLRTELAAARAARSLVDAEVPTTLISRELAAPKPAFLLTRGEYDQHGEQVERRTPAALPPMDAALPNNRLGLAQWVVAPTNPLAARVAVNRFWQQVFGTGLVKTANDFGSQGEAPSHPELLDGLATEFIADLWNVKNLMRRLVTSSTYRQTSHVAPALYVRDPENRLLARGVRFRLDAETLRDQALFTSGLLVEKLGGPSVKPPQPAGLWEAVGFTGSNTEKFVADAGPDKVHRRTLYTFLKRTAPAPEMSTLDAPSRESCTVRRERTNTPLQALLLLNDPQYVEAARGLALRTQEEGGATEAARAAFLFRTATCRSPNIEELTELVEAYREELTHYRSNAEAAKQLAANGSTPADATLDPAELAAWMMAANVVLNLDEVVTKN